MCKLFARLDDDGPPSGKRVPSSILLILVAHSKNEVPLSVFERVSADGLTVRRQPNDVPRDSAGAQPTPGLDFPVRRLPKLVEIATHASLASSP